MVWKPRFLWQWPFSSSAFFGLLFLIFLLTIPGLVSLLESQAHQHHGHLNMTRSRKYDHITPILQSLHWLPIKYRISYKILSLAYKALNGLAPAYLTSLLSRYNPSRSLRSQNSGLLVVPRVQVQDLFVTYTIIQRVLTSSEMWVRSAPWTVQYYRKQHKEVYIKWNE